MGSLAEEPSSPNLNLPVIDFGPYHNPNTNPTDLLTLSRSLVHAFHTHGFVYIINHGVPAEVLSQAFDMSKKLFDLPLEEKMKAPHPSGWKHHRGYSKVGLEKVSNVSSKGEGDGEVVKGLRGVEDCKESYEIGSDDNVTQPNIFFPSPSPLPSFRPFTLSFHRTLYELAAVPILSAISLGLGLPDSHNLLNFHSPTYNQLRLLHYPPVPAEEVERGEKERMPAHTDWGSITMLFQDDCGGLEVEDPNVPGKFVQAKPVPGAVIVNVGDLLMRWSNDYLKSTLHRVSLPPLSDRYTLVPRNPSDASDPTTTPIRLTSPRYSIPYFLTVAPETVIEPLPSELCVNAQRPRRYEAVTQGAYAEGRARVQY